MCDKYSLTYSEELDCVPSYVPPPTSNATALQYYYANRDIPDYQDTLRTYRSTYYTINKTKHKALHLAHYANDPVFR